MTFWGHEHSQLASDAESERLSAAWNLPEQVLFLWTENLPNGCILFSRSTMIEAGGRSFSA